MDYNKDNIRKYIIYGGAFLMGILVLGSWLKYPKPKRKSLISSDNLKDAQFILTLMKDLKGQTFSIWIQVADIRNRVVKENNSNPVLEDGRHISEVLHGEVKSLYLVKKRMVCLKHQIDEHELDEYVNEIYKNDEKIQQIQDELENSFKRSMEGIYPSLDLDPNILKRFSPGKILYLDEKIFRESGKKFVKVYKNLRQQGETDFSLNNKKFVDIIRQQKIADMKTNLLMQNGFSEFQESSTEILGKINQIYRQKDEHFAEKLDQLERMYDVMMDQLTTTTNIPDDLIEQIFGKEKQFAENTKII